jgi:hypothetical protein
VPTPETPAKVPESVIQVLPQWLFLPVGVILLWPLLYGTQCLAGRSQGLSAGEWLLGLAWLACLALAGVVVWQHTGTLPGFLTDYVGEYLVVGHMLGVLALGALAAVLLLADLAGRWPQPWTHRLGLGLLLWQVIPVALAWAWHVRLQ